MIESKNLIISTQSNEKPSHIYRRVQKNIAVSQSTLLPTKYMRDLKIGRQVKKI